ncbi:unnamed protein product [Discosporangium mesarthrocarpum]
MTARQQAATGKLSEASVVTWLGDTEKYGVSRVRDICRMSVTKLSISAGSSADMISFQVVTRRREEKTSEPMAVIPSPNQSLD